MIKKQIPNIITLSNLACGTIAIMSAALSDLITAAVFVILGAIFDFFDGMTARLLHVQSPMGKELDSLSDVVTFGVAPGFIAFSMLTNVARGFFWWLPCIAILIPVFSSYRLAKFNLDERQTSSFIGLPTPANALIWLSLGAMSQLKMTSWMWSFCGWNAYDLMSVVLESPWFLTLLLLLLCVALVSELPLFSLKFHNLSWTDNKVRFIFLIISFVMILITGILAIPFVMILYIVLSIFFPPTKQNISDHD